MLGLMEQTQQARLQHNSVVASLMYKTALLRGWGEQKAKEMYTLGLVHDISKSFTSEKGKDSAKRSGELLKAMRFQYWKEVYYHGRNQQKYTSEELNLLNWANLQVTSEGQQISFNDRLSMVGKKFGVDSKKYKDVKYEIALLIKWQMTGKN